MKKHELKLMVEGIECPGCATDMENVLVRVDGILKVNVNYAEGSTTVEYDPSLINEEQIVFNVRRLGIKSTATRPQVS